MGKPMYKWYQVYLTIVLNPNPKSEPLSTLQNLRWEVVSYILQLNSFSKVSPHHRQTPWAGQHAVKGVTSWRRPKFLGEGAVTVTHNVHQLHPFQPDTGTPCPSRLSPCCEGRRPHSGAALTRLSFRKSAASSMAHGTNSEVGTRLWV